jgi:hypothetical protein
MPTGLGFLQRKIRTIIQIHANNMNLIVVEAAPKHAKT